MTDTTPPTTQLRTLAVDENSGATAIGIAAPVDPDNAVGSLTATVTGLPTDGTVVLSDGTTAVTSGERLTIAQLTGLEFVPSQIPPEARTVKVSAPGDCTSALRSSPQTNAPLSSATARWPAAKLHTPLAVFDCPPATVE